MKKYQSPAAEILSAPESIITESQPVIVDRGYDLPGIPALLS